ncbi:hypothetical protein AB0M36_33410 [Actinoplanes sp. NPDC051346]|uniref:hypothetical protein n=1 Tax=Actinoplanes sp. NPDC051346 TaxID=3155048 RepID=UPI003439B297
MSILEYPKYSLVECRIARHQHYGLVVRTAPGDQPGFIDESAISDQPYAPVDEWPEVGETLLCVVLGSTRDGRLRLSSRPRDVALARAVVDVEAALSIWRRIRDEAPAETGLLMEFFESQEAVPTLRWALGRPHGSPDHSRAFEIVEKAPDWLRRKLR